MKQFSLEEFKKNPNRKVVTKKGRQVRIVCTDAVRRYPIIALVKFNGEEELNSYLPDGRWSFANESGEMNLFFAPEKKSGWANIYRSQEGNIFLGKRVYASKEKAEEFKDNSGYLDTIHIEWEEE